MAILCPTLGAQYNPLELFLGWELAIRFYQDQCKIISRWREIEISAFIAGQKP
jgi:hypothetical protein